MKETRFEVRRKEKIIQSLNNLGYVDERQIRFFIFLTAETTEFVGKIIENSSSQINLTGCMYSLASAFIYRLAPPIKPKEEKDVINLRLISLKNNRIYISQIHNASYLTEEFASYRLEDIRSIEIIECKTERNKCKVFLKRNGLIMFEFNKSDINVVTNLKENHQSITCPPTYQYEGPQNTYKKDYMRDF